MWPVAGHHDELPIFELVVYQPSVVSVNVCDGLEPYVDNVRTQKSVRDMKSFSNMCLSMHTYALICIFSPNKFQTWRPSFQQKLSWVTTTQTPHKHVHKYVYIPGNSFKHTPDLAFHIRIEQSPEPLTSRSSRRCRQKTGDVCPENCVYANVCKIACSCVCVCVW
jgi:hypothetical protein